jgi:macrolide-specific efflux system membrane fusion protein
MIPSMQLRQLSSGVRKPVFSVNLALAALVLAGGGWAYSTVWASDDSATGSARAANANQATATTRDVTASVSSSGTVASSNVVTATFTTNATVTKIYVALGQHVTKGQVLARVDATAANEQLQTAQDNLTSAEDSLSRAKGDSDTSAIDTAQSQVDSANDAVVTAQAAVTGCVLKAPITGTIIAQNGVVGASSSSSSASSSSSSGSGGSGGSAGSGGSGASSSSSSSSSSSGFMKIADLTKMEVDTDFAEADTAKLKVGMKATITWNALSSATATGTVASIDPTATTSNNVVSYGVVVKLSTRPTGIRIGQSTNVVVTTASASNVLAVPTAAVTTVAGISTVEIVGQTTRTRVGVGVTGDTFTEITSGLQAGENVVLPAVTTSGNSTTTNPFGGGGLGGFGGGAGGLGGGGGFTRGGTGGTGGGR